MTQNSKLINFKRERDLGEVLSDTFKFIRLNYKILLQVFTRVVGPVLLLAVLTFVGYNFLIVKQGFSMTSIVENSRQVAEELNHFGSTFFITFFLFLMTSLLFYAVFYAAFNYSVKSYIENDGQIDVHEVSSLVRQHWGSFLGLAFIGGLFVFIGLFFCFIPGIYLSVPMSLIFSIAVFDELDTGGSIAHSFKLIRGNWWMSFFTFFIMGIIYYLASSVFQMPATIYVIVKGFTGAGSNTMADIDWNNAYDLVYIALLVVATIGRFLLYSIMIITSIFVYFSLNEKLNQTGAYETINKLGDKE